MSDTGEKYLKDAFEEGISAVETVRDEYEPRLKARPTGTVTYVGEGIARANGLPGARSEELVRFPGGKSGMVFNLDPEEVSLILLDKGEEIDIGAEVRCTGRVIDTPVGEELIGRIVDPLGRPRDDKGPLRSSERLPIEQPAPGIMERAPVQKPLQTGLKIIDALIPIGRGQRELILGDRQTGKTAIALDTIINQKGEDVICIYCAIGQRSSGVARLADDLEKHDAFGYTFIVFAGGEDTPGLQYIAPYAAMSMGEYFRDKGRDALVIFDDLSVHAAAYREMSLLLRRPPGREAYPGDIFYIHSRLLERATHLDEEHGGGSLTALPIVETQAQNLSAYIPTNLISITDGQVYLSPSNYRRGLLPAVDVGKSVSRVGGKTQLPAYRDIAGDLRLSYSQFEELESFSRFSARLDEDTRRRLERGRRIRQALKQNQYDTYTVFEQIAVLLAVTSGLFDKLEPEEIGEAEKAIRKLGEDAFPDLASKIKEGEGLDEDDRERLLDAMRKALEEDGRGDEDSGGGESGRDAERGGEREPERDQ